MSLVVASDIIEVVTDSLVGDRMEIMSEVSVVGFVKEVVLVTLKNVAGVCVSAVVVCLVMSLETGEVGASDDFVDSRWFPMVTKIPI